jgi:tRNA-dihydrouridine synthase
MADDYEPDRKGAAIEFRKHLGWYVKGLPGSADLRKQLHAVTSLGEVEGIFETYLRERERYAPAPESDSESESLETAPV